MKLFVGTLLILSAMSFSIDAVYGGGEAYMNRGNGYNQMIWNSMILGTVGIFVGITSFIPYRKFKKQKVAS